MLVPARNPQQFLSFKKALLYARTLTLSTQDEWKEWSKSGARPANIPSNPNQAYKHEGWGHSEGWQGWGHWLGIVDAAFLPFKKALLYARSLNLKTQAAWREFQKSGARPSNVPSAPERVYKHVGWQGFGHWLKDDTCSKGSRFSRDSRFSKNSSECSDDDGDAVRGTADADANAASPHHSTTDAGSASPPHSTADAGSPSPPHSNAQSTTATTAISTLGPVPRCGTCGALQICCKCEANVADARMRLSSNLRSIQNRRSAASKKQRKRESETRGTAAATAPITTTAATSATDPNGFGYVILNCVISLPFLNGMPKNILI